MAAVHGVAITPVWNKSFRDHGIIGTTPEDTRRAADAAAKKAGWRQPYFLDADHIGLHNVAGFIASCDFFTIDVADEIWKAVGQDEIETLVASCLRLVGTIRVPGLSTPIEVTDELVRRMAAKYLSAIKQAGDIHRHIAARKAGASFVVEVSMDESAEPQSPTELLFILACLAAEGVPVHTIAPKFTGRFNKGVDYVGDVATFAREFENDVAVAGFAAKEFGLPADLKLSVHSGSDKFSLYRAINDVLRKRNAGVHLKTAGTTWLEELIGLASAGDHGLGLAKEVYRHALDRLDELCGPYAAVVSIERGKLPDAGTVRSWTAQEFVAAVQHEPGERRFNPHVRQLLHVGYKIAAEMGERYLSALDAHATVIADHVTDNLYRKHIVPLFGVEG